MNSSAAIVTPTWLAAHLDDPKVKIIDASWVMPGSEISADTLFQQAHIPGAVRFDIDAIEMPDTGLPHMLASAEDFGKAVELLGISDQDTIIVYDSTGVFMAASRVWYNFHIMGAEDVRILDGGLPAWQQAGLTLQSGSQQCEPTSFKTSFDPSRVKSRDDIRQIIADGNAQIIDARASNRFTGAVEESRAGLRSGHMPEAINLPFASLLQQGEFRDVTALRALFVAAGIDLDKPIVTTCGSGVTACVLNIALDQIGHKNHAMYDGSWTEWGMEGDTEVLKGA